MLQNRLANISYYKYSREFKHWIAFCDQFNLPIWIYSTSKALIFLAWLFIFRPSTTAGVAESIMQSIRSTFKSHNIPIKNDQSVNAIFKFWHKFRPSSQRIRFLLCIELITLMILHWPNKNTYEFWLFFAMISCAYECHWRPSDFSFSPSVGRILSTNQIQAFDTIYGPSVCIKTSDSKMNKKHRRETIHFDCQCGKHIFNIRKPCAVHILAKYLEIRNNTVRKNNKILFCFEDNQPATREWLDSMIKKAIGFINQATNLNLDATMYTPGSIRIGAATDDARIGIPGYQIALKGRWDSDQWRKTYISLIWTDLIKITKLPLHKLKQNIKNPF